MQIKSQPKKPSGFSRKIEEATGWNHPGALSNLRFNVPVLLLLRLVSRVSWRSTAEGLEKTALGVKFRFAFAPCIVSVAILSLTCVVVSCLVVGLCDTS